jgi:hypothetical protein
MMLTSALKAKQPCTIRPTTLSGAHLRRWRRRLLPATSHDAWRGRRPIKVNVLTLFGLAGV